jgi:hypothetical protein
VTLIDILALIPGFAGLALSIFLLWRTELRQARMSLKLLAPPDAWTVSIARQGSPVQATDPVDADYVSMRGIFPVSATNDGPRGGALWNLTAEAKGLDVWRINWFTPGKRCHIHCRVGVVKVGAKPLFPLLAILRDSATVSESFKPIMPSSSESHTQAKVGEVEQVYAALLLR